MVYNSDKHANGIGAWCSRRFSVKRASLKYASWVVLAERYFSTGWGMVITQLSDSLVGIRIPLYLNGYALILPHF